MARILVVDDDIFAQAIVKALLEREEHEVKMIQEPRLALEFAREWRPQVVILDMQMPEISGAELLGQIRADEILRTVPTIILSSLEKKEVIRPLMLSGANGYCAKSMARDHLGALIRSVLAGKKDLILPEHAEAAAAKSAHAPVYAVHGSAGILALSGPLDERIDQGLIAGGLLAQTLARDLIIDVTACELFSRKGILILSRLLQGARARRRQCILVATGDQAQQLRDGGLDAAADIVYSIEDALRFVR